jgi:hypothetical protein
MGNGAQVPHPSPSDARRDPGATGRSSARFNWSNATACCWGLLLVPTAELFERRAQLGTTQAFLISEILALPVRPVNRPQGRATGSR